MIYTPSSLAHGVQIDYITERQVKVTAAFDNGEVMSEAQVTVYAPDDAAEPWTTGMTDGDGVYVFTPDETLPGHWTVQVRKAGHGGNLAIEVHAGESAASVGSGATGYSAVQVIIMAGCVVWGLIGTALYYRRKS